MSMGKVIFYLFVILAVGAGVYSYRYSEKVYRFYLLTYYEKYRKATPEDLAAEARKLYEEKKFPELKRYCERALVVFPKNAELNRLLGHACMHTGEIERGARLLLGSLDRTKPNTRELFTAIEVLYRNRLFTDLVVALARFPFSDDMMLTFMFGVAQFHLDRHDEADRWLRRSQVLGNTDGEVSFYRGTIAERAGRDNQALEQFLAAYRGKPRNQVYRDSLFRLYKKMGRYADAARLSRRESVR